MLERAPLNVLFASFACSPKAWSMIVANVSKSIILADAISRMSASDIPMASPIIAAALRPLAASCISWSPIKAPWPATEANILEMSSYELFVIAATPEIALSDVCIKESLAPSIDS